MPTSQASVRMVVSGYTSTTTPSAMLTTPEKIAQPPAPANPWNTSITPPISQVNPSNRVITATVWNVERRHSTPTTMVSKPNSASSTRPPPLASSTANAATNQNTPAMNNCTPNNTASTATVGSGQISTTSPIARVKTPKAIRQPFDWPTEARVSAAAPVAPAGSEPE